MQEKASYTSDDEGIYGDNANVKHYSSSKGELDIDRPSDTLKSHRRGTKSFFIRRLQSEILSGCNHPEDLPAQICVCAAFLKAEHAEKWTTIRSP